MIYCFDIDGTICTNTDGDYERARPYAEAIAHLNALHDAGHRIILFTARGSTTGIDWRQLTEVQLRTWGVRYHQLQMGKPQADVYVDDKAVNPGSLSVTQNVGVKCESNGDHEPQQVLGNPTYLDVTYSERRAPRGRYPHLLGQWLLKNVYKKPGYLLDLGCGCGEHLAAFADLGFDVAGVDVSPRAMELSRGHRVEVADLERDQLPFPAASFDYVFSKSVVEHMRNPIHLLSKAIKALRPGGTAVIMTPSWRHTYRGAFYIDHTHVTPFTAPSLADALAIAGFKSVTVSDFYQLPFVWRFPLLKPAVRLVSVLPLPYRPLQSTSWPEGLNKLVRFSKEVMLLGVGTKPGN